jgi:uncharacterized protein (TIGR04255 family)
MQEPTANQGPVRFEFPPVAETVLGVQFAPIRKLTAPYQGLFWSKVRRRYPVQEVHPPLAPAPPEAFKGMVGIPGVRVEITTEPDARCWFIDETTTQLIQVQRDRFVRNWRKGLPPNDEYPTYERLRPRFEQDWGLFLDFLNEEDLGKAEVHQCEITYINHIELGTAGWDALGDMHKILTIMGEPLPRSFLPRPEMFVLNTSFVMGNGEGRLHVGLDPAIRALDRKQVVQLTLTARGTPKSPSTGDVLQWFDLGHEWVVQGFADLTAAEMQRIWRRL